MRITELFESDQPRIVTLWHGGRSLESDYLEVRAHKKGRWEHGPGLYLTTLLDTARKYAKGGGKLYRVTVALGRNIDEVAIDIEDAISFVNQNVIARLRPVMISDLQDTLARRGHLPAETLVNLCLNHQAIPNNKTDRLRQFLIDHGVDYTRTRYGGRNETVVVVVNPRIIKKIEIVPAAEVDSTEYIQTINEAATGTRLGDLIKAKVGNQDADFWIIRRGSDTRVGEPKREYDPEAIGITVTRRDLLDAKYLFYMMQHLWMQGMWKKIARGTTRLVAIRTDDILNIPVG